jgi:hypothetical protein
MEAALAWPSKYLAKDDPVLSAQVQRTAFYLAMGKDMSYAAERLKRSVGYLGYRYRGGLDLIAAALRARGEPVFFRRRDHPPRASQTAFAQFLPGNLLLQGPSLPNEGQAHQR